jgi:hypothetical protein
MGVSAVSVVNDTGGTRRVVLFSPGREFLRDVTWGQTLNQSPPGGANALLDMIDTVKIAERDVVIFSMGYLPQPSNASLPDETAAVSRSTTLWRNDHWS